MKKVKAAFQPLNHEYTEITNIISTDKKVIDAYGKLMSAKEEVASLYQFWGGQEGSATLRSLILWQSHLESMMIMILRDHVRQYAGLRAILSQVLNAEKELDEKRRLARSSTEKIDRLRKQEMELQSRVKMSKADIKRLEAIRLDLVKANPLNDNLQSDLCEKAKQLHLFKYAKLRELYKLVAESNGRLSGRSGQVATVQSDILALFTSSSYSRTLNPQFQAEANEKCQSMADSLAVELGLDMTQAAFPQPPTPRGTPVRGSIHDDDAMYGDVTPDALQHRGISMSGPDSIYGALGEEDFEDFDEIPEQVYQNGRGMGGVMSSDSGFTVSDSSETPHHWQDQGGIAHGVLGTHDDVIRDLRAHVSSDAQSVASSSSGQSSASSGSHPARMTLNLQAQASVGPPGACSPEEDEDDNPEMYGKVWESKSTDKVGRISTRVNPVIEEVQQRLGIHKLDQYASMPNAVAPRALAPGGGGAPAPPARGPVGLYPDLQPERQPPALPPRGSLPPLPQSQGRTSGAPGGEEGDRSLTGKKGYARF